MDKDFERGRGGGEGPGAEKVDAVVAAAAYAFEIEGEGGEGGLDGVFVVRAGVDGGFHGHFCSSCIVEEACQIVVF